MRRSHLKPHLVFPGASVNARYHCNRCQRDLPELAFRRMVHWELNNSRLMKRHANALHPICRMCLEQIRGEHIKHPLYTMAADRFFQSLMNSLKGGAKTRRIPVFIRKDDILGLYLEQEGRCALSGAKMVPESGVGMRNRMRPSVDRIDSGGYYSADNIQLICAQVNIMKHNMSQVDFLRWCNRIVNHRAQAEDALLKLVS